MTLILKIFKEHVVGDIVNAYRVRLTINCYIMQDKATCDILMKKFNNKEYSDTTLKIVITLSLVKVLYLKYVVLICDICIYC